jgi:hypothetical protein
MSTGFKESILPATKDEVFPTSEVVVGSANLVRLSTDVEICRELPTGYVYKDVDTFLVFFATLIKDQWDGKPGVMLNNGCLNIFYVAVNSETFAVNVRWNGVVRKWDCYASRLGEGRLTNGRWDAGTCVFSATAG